MTAPRPCFALLLGLLVALLCAPTLHAAELQIATIEVGFGGRYKVGRWTPVAIDLRGGDEAITARVEIQTLDGDGETVVYRDSEQTPPVPVAAGGEATARRVFKVGRANADLTIRLIDGGKTLVEKTFHCTDTPGEHEIPYPVNSLARLVLVLGANPGVIERTSVDGPLDFDPNAVYVARLEDAAAMAKLPDRWYGYDGVDAVVASTSSPEIYRGLIGTTRLVALDSYVRLGGRFVFTAASQADEVFRDDFPLARFAPGRLDSVARLPSSTNLEAFARTQSSLALASLDAAERPAAARLVDVRGVVQTFEGADAEELPLVVRSAYGLGEVGFVALDLDRAPLRDWPGSRRLIAKLLRPTSDLADLEEDAPTAGKSNLQDYGFNDFAGMLRAALEDFDGVKPTSFTMVAALIGVYILLIGPLDYLIVHRLLRRPELTWVTFPISAAAFCVFAYFLTYQLKGRELRLNQIDVVDVDSESGQVRGLTLWNVFSPRPEQFDFSLDVSSCLPSPRDVEAPASWLGTPGQVFNGLDSYGGAALFGAAYRIMPAAGRIDAATVQTWNTKAFAAEWSAQIAAGEPGGLVEQASRAAAHVRGRISNPFTFALHDCRLFFGPRVYQLGDLAPGESASVDVSGRDSTLRTLLQERSFTIAGAGDTPTPMNAASTDPFYILDKMLFHDSIDGPGYTGVYNRSFDRFDATSLLANGRAVLVGRAETAGATVEADGEPLADRAGDAQAYTVVRVFYPVAAPDAAPDR